MFSIPIIAIFWQWVFHPEEESQEMKTSKANIEGSKIEHNVFEKIKECFLRANVKNTVVFSGWQLLNFDGKSIIHIEVKSSPNLKSIKKGIQQLKEGKEFFASCIPFPRLENWNYIQVLCFGNEVKNDQPCGNCKSFLLTKGTNLSSWWMEMVKNLEVATTPCHSSYIKIVKFLIFQMFLQEECVTKGM